MLFTKQFPLFLYTFQNSNPVYIKTDQQQNNANQAPKFIPNVGFGQNQNPHHAAPNMMNTQEQMINSMRQQQNPLGQNMGGQLQTGFQSGLMFNQQNLGGAGGMNMGMQNQQQRPSMGAFNQQQQPNNHNFNFGNQSQPTGSANNNSNFSLF